MLSNSTNHALRYRALSILLLASLLALTVTCEVTAEETPVASDALQKQIKQLIIQLDGDRFDIRQLAQQQLGQIGKPALALVVEATRSNSLEISTRATNILLNWAESSQKELRLAALEKLANLPHRPREAAMATRLLADVREQLAIQKIKQLGAKVTDEGNIFLQIVVTKDWTGGDDGLKHLADLRRISTLSFQLVPISDAGSEYLAKVPQIHRLELYGTDISEAAIKRLKQRLPNTFIDARDGPMLGIYGDQGNANDQSVAVTNVVKNGAAFRAGILPGDRISKIDGEKLTNFKSLIDRIKKRKPGETVTLTVLRNGKTQNLQVTFDRWGATDNTNVVLQERPPRRALIQRLPTQGQGTIRSPQVPRR